MAKERLGIISSYNELCGNARYTKALEEALSHFYDVTVVPLNGELLRAKKLGAGRLHIYEVCERLKQFDCVNIQFESSLFGSDVKQIWQRFRSIAQASTRLSLTMHSVKGSQVFGKKECIKALLKGGMGSFLKTIYRAYHERKFRKLNSRIIKFCNKREIPIIVHTKMDKDFIKLTFDYNVVYDHPLCFYDRAYIQSVAQSCTKKEFHARLHLDEEHIYIGIFGFISSYKGYETILKAMQYLPPNYELIIVGSQHPQSIKAHLPVDPYINHILELTRKLKLLRRVKFHRTSDDNEFLIACMHCDIVVLPYLEVGQGGSAVAALALELGANVIFSQTGSFLELEKYAPHCFKMVSIGNYLELADAILRYRKETFAPHLEEFYKRYNARTNAELYQRLLSPNYRAQYDTHAQSEMSNICPNR